VPTFLAVGFAAAGFFTSAAAGAGAAVAAGAPVADAAAFSLHSLIYTPTFAPCQYLYHKSYITALLFRVTF
jgi:hypothetical protein